MKIRAMDSHLHADILAKDRPGFETIYEQNFCGAISWSYVEDIKSYKRYPIFWDELGSLCRDISKRVPFFYMVGIHPRSIPEDVEGIKGLPLEIERAFEKCLSDPLCLGMGELGIDSKEFLEQEIYVFRHQLDWCVNNLPADKRIGIHTPKNNKEEMTEKILRILEEYSSLKDRIIIDHTTPVTWQWVFEEGYMCGVTLQKGKCSIEDLQEIIQNDLKRAEKTILNSDSGSEVSDFFMEFLKKRPFDEIINQKLLLDNSVKFFNLEKLV